MRRPKSNMNLIREEMESKACGHTNAYFYEPVGHTYCPDCDSWVDTQSIHTNDDMPCFCDSCGQKYKMDVMIENKLFKRIKAFIEKEKGSKIEILCPLCICKAIEEMDGHSAYKLTKIV